MRRVKEVKYSLPQWLLRVGTDGWMDGLVRGKGVGDLAMNEVEKDEQLPISTHQPFLNSCITVRYLYPVFYNAMTTNETIY